MKIIITLCVFLFSGCISAANITWGSASSNVSSGDVFTIDIVGTGFISNVDGGGVGFAYDSAVLNVQSISIDESVWDLGAGIRQGVIDNALGEVNGISVNAWSSVSGSFSVASVTFMAIGTGESALSLFDWSTNPWASNGQLINPVYTSATVSVSSVPLPASFWLFATGILGLFRLVKQKK